MKLINFDIETPNITTVQHHWLLPASIRCCIIGPSGCGKTNLILNLLLHEDNLLHYDQLYIYSKSLQQDKYAFLQQFFNKISISTGHIIAHFYSSSDDILAPEALDPTQRNIMIFDDIVHEKQDVIEQYFSMGRHSNTSCFYLCQSYFKIPKQLIRDNANLIILFRQDTANIRAIYNSIISSELSIDEFKYLIMQSSKDEYGFCTIDLTSKPWCGKYRIGLDEVYIPLSLI